jgi:methyl-accepting chemotaxis protein
MSDLDRIHHAIDDELAACAERVSQLLKDASDLSEREVLAAGERVSAIKDEARAHLESLKSVTRTFQSGHESDTGNLSVAIAAQSRVIERLIARLRAGQAVQREATAAVAEAAERIDKFVGTIGDIAIGLRVLTLNARIEAARRGAQGAAFATIADSMRSLTTDVQSANEGIGAGSTELTRCSHKVQETDADMQSLMTEAETELSSELHKLLRAYEGAQNTSTAAARVAVTRASKMVELTNDILSHLQFQDRMAQVLMEANRNIDKTRSTTNEILSRAGDENVDDLLGELRQKGLFARVRLSGESELDSSDRGMESGVVMMF